MGIAGAGFNDFPPGYAHFSNPPVGVEEMNKAGMIID
jgi:hypothetical protein